MSSRKEKNNVIGREMPVIWIEEHLVMKGLWRAHMICAFIGHQPMFVSYHAFKPRAPVIFDGSSCQETSFRAVCESLDRAQISMMEEIF